MNISSSPVVDSSHQSNMNILSVSVVLIIISSFVEANHGRFNIFLSTNRQYLEEKFENIKSHNKHLNDQSAVKVTQTTVKVTRHRPCYQMYGNVSNHQKSECKPDAKMLRIIRRCAKTSFTSILCRPFSVNAFKNLSSKNLFY